MELSKTTKELLIEVRQSAIQEALEDVELIKEILESESHGEIPNKERLSYLKHRVGSLRLSIDMLSPDEVIEYEADDARQPSRLDS